MLVGFFVLGFDTGTEIVEAYCEDGDVACWIWVFANRFLPKCVVSGVRWSPIKTYLIRINEIIEVMLTKKKGASAVLLQKGRYGTYLESALRRSRIPCVVDSFYLLL